MEKIEIHGKKRCYDEIHDSKSETDVKRRRRGDAEKKRRDRINRCLEELEDLIPMVRHKKLTAKVDKAEILEMTVDFVKLSLQQMSGSLFDKHYNHPFYSHFKNHLESSPSSRDSKQDCSSCAACTLYKLSQLQLSQLSHLNAHSSHSPRSSERQLSSNRLTSIYPLLGFSNVLP